MCRVDFDGKNRASLRKALHIVRLACSPASRIGADAA
jgi:hypothetical protein